MTAFIFGIVTGIILAIVAAFLLVLFDGVSPSMQADSDSESLLRNANKSPRRRAF